MNIFDKTTMRRLNLIPADARKEIYNLIAESDSLWFTGNEVSRRMADCMYRLAHEIYRKEVLFRTFK